MLNFAKSRPTSAWHVAIQAVCLPVLLHAQSQSIGTGRTFPMPLTITITDTNGNTVPGQLVTFVAPTSGPGGTFAGGVTTVSEYTDANGVATAPPFTANTLAGSYSVTAGNVGISLANLACTGNPLVTSNADSGAGTLRAAIQTACPGSAITFNGVASPIKLVTRLRIDDNLIIQGPGSANLAIDGQQQTRLFFLGGGNVTISGMTLQNGMGQGGNSNLGGGGAGMGGAIFVNGGAVTIHDVVFNGNTAQGGGSGSNDGGGGFGGNAPAPTPPVTGGGPVYCDPNYCYNPGGFGASGTTSPSGPGLNGASGGDLLGSGGSATNLGSAGIGYLGAGGAASLTGAAGSGGFGGGGGFGAIQGGAGGFGAGGGASSNVVNGRPNGGVGGWAAGPGYGLGGGGAGFGGAIFVLSGTLVVESDSFISNKAAGGLNVDGAHDKGGALFIFNDLTPAGHLAHAYDFGGNQYQNNVSYFAGFQEGPYGYGNPPTLNTCPGADTADICGILTPGSTSPLTGDNQTVNLLAPLSPLSVQVTPPVSGIPVAFTVVPGPNGAGAVFAGGSSAQTVLTNSSGVATAPPLTANNIAGAYRVNALSWAFSVTNNDNPTHLAFAAVPASGKAGQPLGTIIVQALDVNGSASASYTGLVTLTVAGDTFAAGSVTTVNATAGRATFNNVTLANAGTATITASAPGLAPAVSSPIPIASLADFTITALPSSETVLAGTIGVVLLQLQSVNGFSGTVTLTCSGQPAGASCGDLPQNVPVKTSGSSFAASGVLFQKSVPAGVYAITFTGVSGSLTHSVVVQFTKK